MKAFSITIRNLRRILAAILLAAVLLSACMVAPRATQASIEVEIQADGESRTLQMPAGSTVQQALDAAGLSLEALDRTEPPLYTTLKQGDRVRLVRVTEQFEVVQVIIPYEHQVLRNESLPVEQEVLIQKGKNGLQEITYRRVFEDGVEVYNEPLPVNSVIIEEAAPEIRMIGVQTPLAPALIPGRLFYIRDGNLWSMQGSTADRRALLATGDLDGRVLSLSDDGQWMLFTRRLSTPERINALWAADLSVSPPDLVDLKIPNVIHFADWVPGSNTKIVFSTVEKRDAAPGWQSNNDLNAITFSRTGWTTKWTVIVEPNAGGIYGWWGSSFAWAPDAIHLAYARADGIGRVNYKDGSVESIMQITPLQTRGDWAWVPGISWGPDGGALYTVDHVAPPGTISAEESQQFDLTAIALSAGVPLHLAPQTGMFAYPLVSPLQERPGGDIDYQVAFLQAAFPNQSETSRYRLAVMDRDGSDRKILFPAEGIAGMEPLQHWGAWSPEAMPESGAYALAVIYQGNLWLVDTVSGQAVQVTGDGLTSRVLWR